MLLGLRKRYMCGFAVFASQNKISQKGFSGSLRYTILGVNYTWYINTINPIAIINQTDTATYCLAKHGNSESNPLKGTELLPSSL